MRNSGRDEPRRRHRGGGRGAAVLVDPTDARSIAAGIDEVSTRRDELRRLGIARAGEFTWGRSADLVEALWRELV